METNERIVSRKIREDLRRYGWTVLSTVYHNVAFIHTLGLHWSYQHPDFEVLGLPEALGTALLNELAQRVKNGQRVRSGDLLEDVAEDVALWVTANPLDPEGNTAAQRQAADHLAGQRGSLPVGCGLRTPLPNAVAVSGFHHAQP